MATTYEATFYDHSEYGKRSKTYDVTPPTDAYARDNAKDHKYDNSTTRMDDNISSLKVGSQVRVTLNNKTDFRGRNLVIGPGNDIPHLSDYLLDPDDIQSGSFDDCTSSFKVERAETRRNVEDLQDNPYVLPPHAQEGSTETVTPEELQEMYEKFAPLVVFEKDEKYGPSSVEWFLDFVELKKRIKGGMDEVVSEHPTGSDLAQYGGYFEDPTDMGTSYFLKEKNKQGRKGQDYLAHPDSKDFPTCYVRGAMLKSDPAMWDLQYWFFYPYNGTLKVLESAGSLAAIPAMLPGWTGAQIANTFAEHVGDWEHVSVRVKKTSSGTELVKVGFHAHDSDMEWKTPLEIGIDHSDHGVHPIVYAGYGSHGMYPQGNWAWKGAIPDTLADKPEDGRCWKSWGKVSEISYRNAALNNHHWMRYLAVWGQTYGQWIHLGPLGKATPTSPYGPACKSSFYSLG
ncbi:MAG: hypothetical protein Roseis2KO_60250 [Roseivirga sp.]